MRGRETTQQGFFSYVSPEQRVPKNHPLRSMRTLVNKTLNELSPVFSNLYSHTGRPSIPPEMLLRATLLQILYSIRSERLLVEQIDYNILFRWFVGLSMDDPVWDHSSFTTNRDRLLNTEMAEAFFCSVRQQAEEARLLSDEHFSVDGTLIPAWASMKSFQPKDQEPGSGAPGGGRNAEVNFRGQKRRNETHGSTTDPDARLYKKAEGQESKLCYLGHVLMENRNGLAVNCRLSTATGTAERTAAVAMASQVCKSRRRITLAADKAYNTADFVASLRSINATPHVAKKTKHSAVDGRTTRHAGYAVSQRVRKRVEEIFGWLKTIGGFHKVHVRGLAKVTGMFTFALAAYNLVRMRNLGIAASP